MARVTGMNRPAGLPPLQGQRPGLIPAWGIAPGHGFETISSANGAAYHPGEVNVPIASSETVSASGLVPTFQMACWMGVYQT